jgi:hypothetical protein
LKKRLSISQSHIRAKIIGTIFIIIGIVFFVNPTTLNIKIGFIAIFIGTFMIFIITEKSIPKQLSDAQVEENLDTIKKILKDFNLKGNAIFLPKSDNLTEERILIPPNESGTIKIPNINNNTVFLTGEDEKNLGITVPPSGLKLLDEVEKNGDFKNIEIENIEEKLQIFVGMNLLKSLSLKKQKNGWYLELEKPLFCSNGQDLHRQYPCPTCSAIITAITRSLNQKLRIYSTSQNGEKIKYHLNIMKKKIKQGK